MRIEVCGGDSSGEVEFVLIGWQGRIFVGLGSDHTDRKVEAYSVTVSKQMCDKPMASELWELEDVIGHWDRMILRSWAMINGERVLYQEGTLDAMLPVEGSDRARLWRQGPARRLRDVRRHLCRQGRHPPADRFEYELEDPVLKRKISHGYDVIDAAGAGLTSLPSLRGCANILACPRAMTGLLRAAPDEETVGNRVAGETVCDMPS